MTRMLATASSLAAGLLLIASAQASALPGALDPSFGNQGVARSEFGPSFSRIAFDALEPQADGSFFAQRRQGGESTAWIRRYDADGSRDQAYGEESTSERPEAVQEDGKLLKVDCGNSLVRLEADATTPDPTFGTQPCGSHKRSDEVPFNIERILPLASGDILAAGPRMHVVMGAEEPEYVFEQLAIARYDETGKLDTSFGGDGVVLLSTDAGLAAKRLLGMVPRPGGGVTVVAADTLASRYAPTAEHSGTTLLALTAAGADDPAYGNGGQAHLDSLATAFQPLGEGRILLAGDAWEAPLGTDFARDSDLFAARYGDDGQPDASFGSGGIAKLDFGGIDLAGALLVAEDGSVLLGGATTDSGDSYCLRFLDFCEEAPVLAKLTPAGQPDPAFGGAGLLRLDSLAYAYGGLGGGIGVRALAKLPNEDVLAGGGSGTVAFLAAMSQDGALDAQFGQAGLAIEQEPWPSSETANSLGVDGEGRISIAGATNAGLVERFPASAVFRYLSNGELDRSWGGGLGYVRVPAADRISVVADGSAIAAGAGSPITITKLRADGEIDRAFGEDGTTQLQPRTVDVGRLASVALLPDGEVVVAANGVRHDRQRIVIFRLRRDGQPSRAFGAGGIEVLGFGRNHRCSVAQMAIQSDGDIVLAGYVHGAEREKRRETLAVMRLRPDGRRDRAFGSNGLVALRIGRRSAATAVAISPGGDILAGGRSWAGHRSAELLIRLTPRGRLDKRFARRGIASTRVPPKPRGLNGPRTILVGPDRIIVVRDTRHRQLRAYRLDGRLIRSFPAPEALDPKHGQTAAPAALQNGKLLILERGNGFPWSFTLRRLLLR